MKQYLIFIIIFILNVNVFSQSDTLINSKIIFLEKKETLNEQLEKFKGKVIYIDTWATFCSPCIKWLKKKKNYENYFQDNEIVVLCLCFDKLEKQDMWKELIDKYSIAGNHIFIERSFIDNYLTNFKVSRKKSLGRGFPRFLIVNRDGKVVESSAYTPTKMLIKQIEKYL